MSILKLSNINTGYGKKHVLHDVSLDIQPGETLLIVGSNGSGKSTIFKVIYGLLGVWPNSGEIIYDGVVIHNDLFSTPTELLIRKNIIYIPQKSSLFEDLSVLDNLKCSVLHLKNDKESLRRINDVLEKLEVLKYRLNYPAKVLSGGERKILALGMALANRPRLLLLDEPMAGLSDDNSLIILNILSSLKSSGVSMIIAEHRISELLKMTDRIIGLKLGFVSNGELSTFEQIKHFLI